jgi:hypothetical protein
MRFAISTQSDSKKMLFLQAKHPLPRPGNEKEFHHFSDKTTPHTLFAEKCLILGDSPCSAINIFGKIENQNKILHNAFLP